MKVLHVHRIGGIGGSERHLLTLLPALAERGIDVRFLGLDDTSRAPDPFYDDLTVRCRTLTSRVLGQPHWTHLHPVGPGRQIQDVRRPAFS